jgi:hypothetical protein
MVAVTADLKTKDLATGVGFHEVSRAAGPKGHLQKLPGGVPTIPILVSLGCNRGELTGPYSLPRIPFLFTFMRTLLLFFVSTNNSSLFFPINSALFAKKHTELG